MLMADTVMDADEPRFQIGEDEMDDRQIVLGNLWVAALGNGKVFIPALAEAGISTPIVSDGQRPRSNGALHEPTKRVGAPIGYYGEPDTPGIASVLSLVLRGSRFPMTNLDGTSDENLVVDTRAFAASPSTNPCLVYLNMFPRLAADTILIGPHHASAELVENAEGRLIARQAKLSLKLNRRDAGRLAGDQISRPKPCAQRHMAAFHDGANRQARIVAALATAQDTGDEWRCGRDRLRHGNADRRSRRPIELFPCRQHTSLHREKAAETLEATAERASRHAEGRPWLTIHYTHKIYP